MTKRYILGIHSGHDASAYLFENNKLILAIAKERLTRKKHDTGEPIECIEYILNTCNLKKQDIDLVVRSSWFDSIEINHVYYSDFPKTIISYQHHLFHAYAVSLVGLRTEDSIIVINDGRGCRIEDVYDETNNIEKNDVNINYHETESVFLLKNNKITKLEKYYSPHFKNKYWWGSHIDSLGYAYSAVSKIIFNNIHSAGKVMALASFCELSNFNIPDPILYHNTKSFQINPEWINYLIDIENNIHWDTPLAKNLAYNIQMSLEKYYLSRVSDLKNKYKISNFLFGGGVALNCKNNGYITNSNIINSLGVFPASGDDSLSIGAGIWGIRNIFNDYNDIIWEPFLGKTYFNGDLTDFQNHIESIVDELIKGCFIGVFFEGSEYGPRALGHRSILAKADCHDNQKLLNIAKGRESFRPFGALVLDYNFCEISDNKLCSPYMLSTIKMFPYHQKKYPAVVHIDGSTRIQIVDKSNILLYNILKQYEQKTGNILLINTSFNNNEEPIVETEIEALSSAKKMNLDYVFINNKIVKL